MRWLRLVVEPTIGPRSVAVAAPQRIAGDPVPKLRHDCGEELRSFQHLALRRPDLFDRLNAARWRGQALARVGLRCPSLKPLLDLWPYPAVIGEALPAAPLALLRGPTVVIDLEATYLETLADHGL